MLLDEILLCLNHNSIGGCYMVRILIAKYNELAKTFTISDLKKIDDIFKNCKKEKPLMLNFFVQQNLYNKRSGASALINELPFSLFVTDAKEYKRVVFNYVHRQTKKGVTFPICVEVSNQKEEKYYWKFVNSFGKRNLKKLPDYLNYDIITKRKNFDFYRKKHPRCRLTSYEHLANMADALNDHLNEQIRIGRALSVE